MQYYTADWCSLDFRRELVGPGVAIVSTQAALSSASDGFGSISPQILSKLEIAAKTVLGGFARTDLS